MTTAALLFLLSTTLATPEAQPGDATDKAATESTTPRFELDIEVESPEGIREPLDRVAPSASVIGEAEIRASGTTTVAELLRRVAGVDVSRSGSLGKVTTARLDGAASAQTLVLVDGMELNSPTLALADLSDLSVDGIERIEIVRGPMSALYGSQAMGGVIQVFTRRGKGPMQSSAELAGGSYGMVRGAASVHGAMGGGTDGKGVGYSLAASHLHSDGRTFDGPAGSVENDGYDRTVLSGSLDAPFSETTALDVQGRYQEGDREIPIEVFGAQAFDVNSSQRDKVGILTGRLRMLIGSRFEPFVRAGYTGSRQKFDDALDPGEDGPFASDFFGRTRTSIGTASGGAAAHLAEHDRLDFGVEWERRQAENSDNFTGVNFDDHFDTRSFYAQNRLDVASLFTDKDSLIVTVGGRVDDVTSFGTSFNPKASVLWTAPGDVVRLRAGAGRGFRAPSLNELFFPFFGNPDLEPETSRTYEGAIGTRTLGGKLDAELRYFHSDFDDLITGDPVTFLAVNLARARVQGAEIEVRVTPLEGLWIRGSATFQDTEDRETGEELLRRPRRKGALAVAYERAERFRVAVDLTLTGDQRDVPVAGFPEDNPSWTRVDLSGGWTLPFGDHHLELFGRVENLFDRDYAEVTGYPAPGINGEGGVRARF